MNSKKLLERIRLHRHNVKFSDTVKLVEDLGFVLDRIEGSHHIFSKQDIASIIDLQPDKNGDAKEYELKQIVRLVELYNLKLED
jgi:predicted RNA binding protein YcfA (HicA-like mRNA interferase family)